MAFTAIIFIASLLFHGMAYGAPAPQASCSPFITYHANFDEVKAGSGPPSGTGQSDWSGWTVTESLTPFDIKPASGNHVIQSSGPEGSSFAILSDYPGFLESFYFACTGVEPGSGGQSIFPSACSIEVVTATGFLYQGYESLGPYDYSVNYTALSEGYPANMTKVTIGDSVYGNVFYFNVVSGLPQNSLFLDSIVIQQENQTCMGA